MTREHSCTCITRVRAIPLVALIGLAALSVRADDCAPGKPLYVPAETARTALGLKGETRADYLDRRYGTGAWHDDRENAIRIESPVHGAPLAVHIAPIAKAGIRIDLMVESRVEYIGTDNRTTTVLGHRPIGSYDIAANEVATLTVPRDVFRESGALIVAMAMPGMRGARQYAVRSEAVRVADCGRRIYVEDRFSAIRLNRQAGR